MERNNLHQFCVLAPCYTMRITTIPDIFMATNLGQFQFFFTFEKDPVEIVKERRKKEEERNTKTMPHDNANDDSDPVLGARRCFGSSRTGLPPTLHDHHDH